MVGWFSLKFNASQEIPRLIIIISHPIYSSIILLLFPKRQFHSSHSFIFAFLKKESRSIFQQHYCVHLIRSYRNGAEGKNVKKNTKCQKAKCWTFFSSRISYQLLHRHPFTYILLLSIPPQSISMPIFRTLRLSFTLKKMCFFSKWRWLLLVMLGRYCM